MAFPWFRFYHEWSADAKIQTLSFEHQRHFVMLLCWHAAGTLPTLTDDVIAASFRMSGGELAAMKEVFRARGFIGDVGWAPRNWEKRQRPSDDSNARVKAHRQRKRAFAQPAHVTESQPSSERADPCNGDVTVTSPLRNGGVTEKCLNSSLLLTESSDSVLKEEKRRDVTVTSPLQGRDAVVTPVPPAPPYPDPDTSMVTIHGGKHVMTDDRSRDLWRRIWATWQDKKLLMQWYAHQRWYEFDIWVAAFARVEVKYPGKAISLGLVETIAAAYERDGIPTEAPPADVAPSSHRRNGRPRTRTQEFADENDARAAVLRARLAEADGPPDEETP